MTNAIKFIWLSWQKEQLLCFLVLSNWSFFNVSTMWLVSGWAHGLWVLAAMAAVYCWGTCWTLAASWHPRHPVSIHYDMVLLFLVNYFYLLQCSERTEKCNLWNIQDLLIFIAMGFVGGLLGAWFNQLNKHLTVHRILHVNSRAKIVRLVEIYESLRTFLMVDQWKCSW